MADERNLDDKLRELEGVATQLRGAQEQFNTLATSSLSRLARLRERWTLPGGEEIERLAGILRGQVSEAGDAITAASARVQQTLQQGYERQQEKARQEREREEQVERERAAQREGEEGERQPSSEEGYGAYAGYGSYGSYGDRPPAAGAADQEDEDEDQRRRRRENDEYGGGWRGGY